MKYYYYVDGTIRSGYPEINGYDWMMFNNRGVFKRWVDESLEKLLTRVKYF